MKLKSLNTVLAMTAAFGIAFVGVSCKPQDKPAGDDKKGSEPAKEAPAKKEAAPAKKEAAPAKKEAAPAKKEAAPKAK